MEISAHDGFPRWIDSGADFLEVDVRRNRDGTFILSHDEPAPNLIHARLDEALGAGHALQLDLKEPGYEVDVVRFALQHLPPQKVVVTTPINESIRIVKNAFLGLRAGLTLGEHPVESTWRRVKECNADFIALDHRYAKWFERASVPVWLWTVDDERELKRYFDAGWPQAIITNRPDFAVRLRKGKS